MIIVCWLCVLDVTNKQNVTVFFKKIDKPVRKAYNEGMNLDSDVLAGYDPVELKVGVVRSVTVVDNVLGITVREDNGKFFLDFKTDESLAKQNSLYPKENDNELFLITLYATVFCENKPLTADSWAERKLLKFWEKNYPRGFFYYFTEPDEAFLVDDKVYTVEVAMKRVGEFDG